jgi:GTPase
MFKDIANVKLKAGKGGDGRVAFISKNAQKRSDGGNGGNGGDLYIEGTTHLYDYSFLKRDQVISAEDGQIGGTNNAKGRNGNDYVLKVPVATNVYNAKGELVVRVDQPGVRIKLLTGGKGGRGNLAFKSGGLDALYDHTEGELGQDIEAKFELELLGDVIFIGLPNAGKSSILNEITNANAKVAPYAFTTLVPQLGRLDEISLMDLPGLIEKTFEGKGLGTKFVRHTKSAKLVLHFVSLENPDISQAYRTIRTELENIDKNLSELPEVIVLSKTDTLNQAEIEQAIKSAKKLSKNVIAVSIADDNSLEDLKKIIRDFFKQSHA